MLGTMVWHGRDDQKGKKEEETPISAEDYPRKEISKNSNTNR